MGNRMTAAYMSAGHPGIAWITSSGNILINNQSGASRTSAQFTITYPLRS